MHLKLGTTVKQNDTPKSRQYTYNTGNKHDGFLLSTLRHSKVQV